jgi:hypothetical protein
MHKSPVFGIILLLFLASCSAKKQFYIISKNKSLNGRTFVFGKIIDNHGSPMPAAMIQGVNRVNKVQADKDGKYSLEITDRSREISALWLGYLTYKTKGLKVKAGDSIHVDIKLMESDELLID